MAIRLAAQAIQNVQPVDGLGNRLPVG